MKYLIVALAGLALTAFVLSAFHSEIVNPSIEDLPGLDECYQRTGQLAACYHEAKCQKINKRWRDMSTEMIYRCDWCNKTIREEKRYVLEVHCPRTVAEADDTRSLDLCVKDFERAKDIINPLILNQPQGFNRISVFGKRETLRVWEVNIDQARSWAKFSRAVKNLEREIRRIHWLLSS